MFIFAMLVNLIYYIIVGFLLAHAVISWVRPDPYDPKWGPIITFVNQVTDPVLSPIRRRMPPTGMIDFSPLVVWFIAAVVRSILLSIFL